MADKNPSTLKKFMTEQDRKALGNLPTLHCHCRDKTQEKVARPGKTAKDRKRGKVR